VGTVFNSEDTIRPSRLAWRHVRTIARFPPPRLPAPCPGAGVTGVRDQLSGSIRADDGVAVLSLRGEIDIATVPLLRDLVDRAFAAGAPRIVVDLAAVDFLDAGGLSVLVTAAERARMSGASLAIHAASAPIYKLFVVTQLTERLDVQRPPISSALVQGLSNIAAIPSTRDVLDAALKLVVTMAQAVMAGADGASITLPRHGRLGTVAASNDVVLEMDQDQYDTGEGPCLDAATQGERFHILALDEEARWPSFVPRARARGIESILSTPLVSHDSPLGALNVYSRASRAFADHEKEWADQFAAEASTLIGKAHPGTSADALNEQIQRALLSREVIALAQGMVMQRDGVSPLAAYAALRDDSRRTGRPLRDVCDELVGPRFDATPLRESAGGSARGRPTR